MLLAILLSVKSAVVSVVLNSFFEAVLTASVTDCLA